jgi:uncharacterized protein YjdB
MRVRYSLSALFPRSGWVPSVALCLAAVLSVVACNDDAGTGPAVVASVTISPAAETLLVGTGAQLTALARDAAGNEVHAPVQWSSSNPAVVSVSDAGVMRGEAEGDAIVVASVDGQSDTAAVSVRYGGVVGPNGGAITAYGGAVVLTVPAGAVSTLVKLFVQRASVSALPRSSRLVDGSAFELAPQRVTFSTSPILAIKYNSTHLAAGSAQALLQLYGVAGADWQVVGGSSANPATKTVSGAISQVGTYAIFTAQPVDHVVMIPASDTIEVGATQQLIAKAYDATNTELSGRSVRWKSTAPSVASVDQTGLVTGATPGQAVIEAKVEGKIGRSEITVTAAPRDSALTGSWLQ